MAAVDSINVLDKDSIPREVRTVPSRALDAGASSATTPRTVTATDSPEVTVLGTTTGAKVQTDANGTIQQYLRGLVSWFAGFIGTGVKATAVRVVTPSDPDSRPTVDDNAASTITARDIASSSASGQNSVSILTGAPTANSFLKFAINGQAGVRVMVSNVWTGTITFEGSPDGGTSWVAIPLRVQGTAFTTSSPTANGMFYGDVGGLTHFRARATAAWTGTATLACTFTAAGGPVQILNTLRIADNTNGATMAVLPASTIAAATDPSAVVQLHPYSGRAATGTKTNVNDGASSVTILAANADRKAYKIFNDSTVLMYVDESGGTASNTSFSYVLQPGSMYESQGPRIITGAITGIWASDASGAARVTEYT